MSDATFLDDLVPFHAHVGWGELGVGGALGYEGKNVVVGGRRYAHALSTHAPARLLYELDGSGGRFRSSVALNDDVPAGAAEADFAVLANGRTIATAERVVAGEPPRSLEAELDGASLLELVVSTRTYPFCHAVWLEPSLAPAENGAPRATLRDCLDRVELEVPPQLAAAERCLATVVSPGYEPLLDDLLGSFAANSGCAGALLLVFVVGESAEADRVVAKHGATAVRCRALHGVDSAVKSVLYSAARVAPAQRFLCVDADTVVLGDLRPLFAALDACAPGAILACAEENGGGGDVRTVFGSVYRGRRRDLARILGEHVELPATPALNDGVFAATRAALLELDASIRVMPGAAAWLREPGLQWRNQFVFNLALARLGSAVPLDDSYNVQLHATDVDVERGRASFRGRPVRILHANGRGRARRPELLGRYSCVGEPLVGGGADAYAAFVDALRAWIGRHGVGALSWSFYGTTDGMTGRVRDASTFPLLGLLHYLVRANGCVRVVETGTAKGVSAACLASAVAHRPGGRVVTIDFGDEPLRSDLWELLPDELRARIEERRGESVAELKRAEAAGERFHAAVLDTDHSAEHVWREFDVARRLVCAGGPILVHDPLWAGGSVEDALARIAREGYGVVRLWCAADGVQEDDGLGLALIENRRRA